MNDRELQLFEADLRRLVPAKPPAELLARLAAAPGAPASLPANVQNRNFLAKDASAPHGSPEREGVTVPQPSTLNPQPPWHWLPRWLAPAAAVAVVVVLTLVLWPSRKPDNALATPRAKTDDIEFDQQLIVSFDAIAELPGGQPVRFRCCEWEDAVVLRDPARGIVIERRTPRLEVVPVSFEIY